MRSTSAMSSYDKMGKRDVALRDVFDGFCRTLNPSIVCDIGSFNGDESYRFAQMMPSSHVYAFEASPRNFKQFYGVGSRFEGISNFTGTYTAIADEVGTLAFSELQAGEEGDDWRRAASSLLSRSDGLESKVVDVPCTTLDHFFGEDIEENTFALWIDVEGALDKVINGAARVLERTVLIRTEMEWKELWHGQELAPELKSRFENMGFLIAADTYEEDAYDQSDVLLIRRNFLQLITGT